MSVSVTAKKLRVNLKLDDGYTSAGMTKYVSMSLGNMAVNAFDADKVMAIANLLTPVLDKDLLAIEKVETSTLEE